MNIDADQAKTVSGIIAAVLTGILGIFKWREKQAEKLDLRFAMKADKEDVERETKRIDALLENRRENEAKMFDMLGELAKSNARIEGKLGID